MARWLPKEGQPWPPCCFLGSSCPCGYVTLPAVQLRVPLQRVYTPPSPPGPLGNCLSVSFLCALENKAWPPWCCQSSLQWLPANLLKTRGILKKLLAVGSRAEESGTGSSKPAEMSLVTVQTLITGKLHSSPTKDRWVIGVALYLTGCTEQIKAEGLTNSTGR